MDSQVMLLEDATALVLIHFAYLTPPGTVRAQGLRLGPPLPDAWRIACAPHLTEFSSAPTRPFVWHRSDDSRAVTCPLCKATDVFKDAVTSLEAELSLWRPAL